MRLVKSIIYKKFDGTKIGKNTKMGVLVENFFHNARYLISFQKKFHPTLRLVFSATW